MDRKTHWRAAIFATCLYGISFGFGIARDIGSLQDVRLDYAYTSVDLFDALNTFTFQMGF
jgi:hypothetical protein